MIDLGLLSIIVAISGLVLISFVKNRPIKTRKTKIKKGKIKTDSTSRVIYEKIYPDDDFKMR